MPARTDPLRVVKKLSPTQPGAKKLARKYGDELICVRHRQDDQGLYRFTTVEIPVEKVPIQTRSNPEVAVRVGRLEKSLQTVVRASGGKWDPEAKLWRVRRNVAANLGLLERIVRK